LFRALSIIEIFFSAIGREIEMARKIEMARAKEMGRRWRWLGRWRGRWRDG
jgi:hypothetical protein